MADAKQGKTTSEDFYNGSSQSRVVLAKPRLGGFGSSSFASSSSKNSNAFGSVLRPPQLKPNNNPFLKVAETDASLETKKDESASEDRLQGANEEAEAPKFVPLGSSNVTSRTTNAVTVPPQPTTSSPSSGFVFGQNLSERVVMSESTSVNNGEASMVDHSATNGTSELLFTSAAASVKENQEDTNLTEPSGSGDGLAAAAAEYERSHARPPPPTSTITFTGEEDEINVLQISCRLFAWEAGSWRERGRGVLRLNDAGAGAGARLVARVAGSLRVVLNTKLWPAMVLERAGTKSLRISAADAHQQIKLFLIMGSPADIVQLYRALSSRVAISKRTLTTPCTQNTTSQKAAERLEAAADDDYLDKDDDAGYDDTRSDSAPEDKPSDSTKNERLDADEQKTEEYESHVDGMKDNKDTKTLKRKEPAEDETAMKRQCPEILIE